MIRFFKEWRWRRKLSEDEEGCLKSMLVFFLVIGSSFFVCFFGYWMVSGFAIVPMAVGAYVGVRSAISLKSFYRVAGAICTFIFGFYLIFFASGAVRMFLNNEISWRYVWRTWRQFLL